MTASMSAFAWFDPFLRVAGGASEQRRAGHFLLPH